jgi:hypothetical protein
VLIFLCNQSPSSTDFVVAFPSKVIPNSKTQAAGIRFDGILWDWWNHPDDTFVCGHGLVMLACFICGFLPRIFKVCEVLRRDLSHTPSNARCWRSVIWYLQKAKLSFDINFSTIHCAEKARIYYLIVPLLLILCTSHNCRQFATTNLKTYTLRNRV